MFLLDSLLISGIRWTLETVATAAESEMNDDEALRAQLLDAEMRRELGEISDATFRELERDLLARIREIRERRDGGSGPTAFDTNAGAAGGGRLQVEASVEGEFHGDRPDHAAAETTDAPRGAARRPGRRTPSRRARHATRRSS
jgi:hypothetical protein